MVWQPLKRGLMQEEMMGAVGPDDEDFFGPPTNIIQMPNQIAPKPPTSQEDVAKAALTAALPLRRVQSFTEVYDNEEKLRFIIDGELPDTGVMYIGGASGTGKTILAIQIAAGIVEGRGVLSWRLGEGADGARILVLSLEMGTKEFQYRQKHMFPTLTDDQRKLFDDRFMVYSEPEPFELWNSNHIMDLFRIIRAHDVNVVLIDSASVSFAPSLKDDTMVNESLKNLYLLRMRLNVAMIIVSHTRKPPAGIASNPEDVTLNDLFGHSGIAQSASAVVIVMEDEKERIRASKSGKPDEKEKVIHVINAKSRFGSSGAAYKATLTSKEAVGRGEPLMFKRNAIPIEMTEEARKQAKNTPLSGLTGLNPKAFDFSDMEDEDD